MYIVTRHAYQRFIERYNEVHGEQKPDFNFKRCLIGLFLNSFSCHLANYRYERKTFRYDYILNVKSRYRYNSNWLFTITKKYGKYYIVTVVFGYRPKPKIISNNKIPYGEKIEFTD
jgi:hypothetical protein